MAVVTLNRHDLWRDHYDEVAESEIRSVGGLARGVEAEIVTDYRPVYGHRWICEAEVLRSGYMSGV